MHVLYISAARPIEVIEPCNPSPCGINAECTERGTAASCACIRDYIGNPYIECKPECVVNPECPRDKACVNQHCVDPCPGVCGAHATCYVTNHVPLCRCDPGFTGDAFVSCRRITTRKFLFWVWFGLVLCCFSAILTSTWMPNQNVTIKLITNIDNLFLQMPANSILHE